MSELKLKICKNCNKDQGEHHGKTYGCPIGSKGRIGNTLFSRDKVFEAKEPTKRQLEGFQLLDELIELYGHSIHGFDFKKPESKNNPEDLSSIKKKLSYDNIKWYINKKLPLF